MPHLLYGVWDDIVYDNRGLHGYSAPELPLESFDQFDDGNPVDIFLSNRGFLVFSAQANLVQALLKHHERLAAESCGKCTPCRAGSPLIAQQLANACRGEQVDWAELRDITEQMHDTSLCGVGRTGTQPLLDVMRYFPDELRVSPMPAKAASTPSPPAPASRPAPATSTCPATSTT